MPRKPDGERRIEAQNERFYQRFRVVPEPEWNTDGVGDILRENLVSRFGRRRDRTLRTAPRFGTNPCLRLSVSLERTLLPAEIDRPSRPSRGDVRLK